MRYAWIKEHDKEFAVIAMCRILQVSASGYYDSLVRKPCIRKQEHHRIADASARFYFAIKRIYGYRKVNEDLLASNIVCFDETVRRIMRDMGLYSRVNRKFVLTTDSVHSMAFTDNLLNRDFIDSDLVKSALRMAIEQRKPVSGLLHHIDRVSQYASDSFQDLLGLNGIISSMSRKGNCWYNAFMESFFVSLKTDCLDVQKYPTHQSATNILFEYLELFYNRNRIHASLGYVIPAYYEKMHEI